jgi:hypothetical protein
MRMSWSTCSTERRLTWLMPRTYTSVRPPGAEALSAASTAVTSRRSAGSSAADCGRCGGGRGAPEAAAAGWNAFGRELPIAAPSGDSCCRDVLNQRAGLSMHARAVCAAVQHAGGGNGTPGADAMASSEAAACGGASATADDCVTACRPTARRPLRFAVALCEPASR